jgi:hypothetical protein
MAMKIRKILIKVLLGLLIFVATVLVVRAVLNFTEGNRLDRSLNALWERKTPLTLMELYPPCPDEDNAARFWKAAENLCLLEGPDVKVLSEIRQDFNRGDLPDSTKREALLRMIEKNRRVLDLVMEASEKSRFFYDETGRNSRSYDRRIPNAITLIRTMTLFGFDVLLTAEKGDMIGALDRLRAGFRFSELIGQERILIVNLISGASMRQLLFLLDKAVSGREARPELLRTFLDELGDARIDAWRNQLRMSLRGERIFYLDVAQEFLNQRIPASIFGDTDFFEDLSLWLIRPLLKRDIVRNLPKYDELEDIAGLPYYRAGEALTAYAEGTKQLPWHAVISRQMLPNIHQTCLKQAILEALILTSRTGLACRVFKARTGRYPDSLDELVPGLVPAVPIDPFSGDPLVYRRDGEGFVVYSLGSNQKDDGGRSTWMINRLVTEKDDDWTWRETR